MSSRYTGLWKRELIQIGDSEPYEDATVFWLQAETYFVDIRIPFKQPSLQPAQSLQSLEASDLLQFSSFKAFAGTIDCTDTWIRWNRTIDFMPNPERLDQGNVHFEGENLIEIGEFSVNGVPQQYLEVWVPQPVKTRDCWVLELVQEANLSTQTVTSPRALLVGVGEHFIRIYDARCYPPEFVAPAPASLSADGLQKLMQFQVDYGKHIDESKPWQILLSNDPNHVSTSLHEKENYQAKWQNNILIETWETVKGEVLQHHWHVRECTNPELRELSSEVAK